MFDSRFAELSLAEQGVVGDFIAKILESSPERQEKVSRVAEGIVSLSALDQIVVLAYAQFRADTLDPFELEPAERFKTDIDSKAPGVYMIPNPGLREVIQDRIGFFGISNFVEARDALAYPKGHATKAVDHLYKWVAAHNPGSKAVEDVLYYGKTTGMRHDRDLMNGNYRNFMSEAVLFDEEILDEYISLHCSYGDKSHPAYNAMVYMARSLDNDLEHALSLMTAPAARRARKL